VETAIPDRTARLSWMHVLWQNVALLGDLRFIAPALLLLCAGLWSFGKHQEILTMTASLTAAFVLIGTLKYTLNPFHASIFSIELHARDMPSGHAGMSMVFYGGIAVLLARQHWGAWAELLAVLALSVAALVSIAVWLLWWHSRFEVVAGDLAGAVVLLFSERFRGRRDG
jgi:membrane-associated phospholipid phosphatase